MKRSALLIAALAAVLARTAQAQTTEVVATSGFPIGEKSRIHTGLGASAVFDSNPDRLPSDMANSDWGVSFRPNVTIDIPGQAINMHSGADVTISQYFGANGNQSKTLVGTFLNAVLDLGESNSLIGLHFEDQLVRTPTYIVDLGAVAAEERLFAVWSNRGAISLALRPGGGALSIEAGYTNSMSFYDTSFLGSAQRHGILLEAKLKFLPRTAFVFHSDLSFYSSNDDTRTAKSSPYDVTIGLIGQVTTHLSANLAIGFGDTLTWQNGFFSSAASDENRTIIGVAELTFSFLEASRISAGYRRSVTPILLEDNYTSNMPYARLVLGLTPRLTIGGFFEYEFRSYQRDQVSAQILTADARVDYWFFDFLSAGVNYRALAQSGSSNAAATTNVLIGDYTRHMFFVNLNVRY